MRKIWIADLHLSTSVIESTNVVGKLTAKAPWHLDARAWLRSAIASALITGSLSTTGTSSRKRSISLMPSASILEKLRSSIRVMNEM
jgi:hypothetical protein